MNERRALGIALAGLAFAIALLWALWALPAPDQAQPDEPPAGDAPQQQLAAAVDAPATEGRRADPSSAQPRETHVAEPAAETGDEAPLSDLRVQVVDANGQPAPGISVMFTTEEPDLDRSVSYQARTESRGPRALAGFEIEAERILRLAMMRVTEVYAVADLPLRPRAYVALPLSPVRPEPILQLPPLGEMEVRVFENDGSPSTRDYRLSLWIGPAGSERSHRSWSSSIHHPELEQGRGSFPLGLGLDVRIAASPGDGITPGTSHYGPGPIHAGERVAVRMDLPAPYPRVRVRLRDGDGQWLRETRVWRYYRTPKGASDGKLTWTSGSDTDAEGVLDIPFSPRPDGSDQEWILLRDNPEARTRKPFENGTEVAILLLPAQVGAEGHDAGELTLTRIEHPLLVAGHVRLADGQPTNAVIGIYPVEADGSVSNTRLARLRPERDGSFSYCGKAPPSGRVHVSAGWNKLLGDSREVAVGTADVELRLAQAANIVGRYLLDEDVPWSELEVTPGRSRWKAVGPNGGFHIDRLHPGDYELQLVHNGRLLHQGPAVRIDRAGRHDAGSIDLRGRLRVWQIELLGPDGERCEEHRSVEFRLDGRRVALARVGRHSRLTQVLPMDLETTLELSSEGGAWTTQVSWAQGLLRASFTDD